MSNELVKTVSLPLFSAKGWLKFLGILSIIYGILLAITIIGIIVAWLPIWMGVLLFQSATALEEANASEEPEALRRAMSKLKLYFIILGVTSVIGIVVWVISFFLGVAGIFSNGMM